MKNISISKRIGLGVVVPLVGMFAVTTAHVWGEYTEYKRSAVMDHLSTAINGLTALTHNIQIERGASASFIASEATRTPKAVVDARANMDTEFKNLKTLLASLDHNEAPKLYAHLENLVVEIDAISNYRQKVDAKGANVAEVMGYYSKIVKHIFDVNFESISLSPDTIITLELTSMLDLGTTKELAGEERSLVSGLFATGHLSESQLANVQDLIAKQAIMTDNFVKHVPDIHKAEYVAILEGANKGTLNALRKKITLNKDDLSQSGVSQSKWFKTTSDRITKLRELEKRVGENIHQSVYDIEIAHRNALLTTIALALLVFSLAAAAGIAISRSITKPMKRLQDDMDDLAQGNVDFSVKGTEERNELGIMALALEGFQSAEVQKRELEAAAKADGIARAEEQARVEAEKAEQDAAYRKAVQALGAGLERFSNGDFEGPIQDQFPTVLADLREFYNNTLIKLSGTLSQVRSTGATLKGDSATLRDASDDLSRRTEAQAASLEETSTALKQVTSNLRESAKRTEQANARISDAAKNAQDSDKIVNKAITAMGRIENTSGQIAQIVSVIDEIAFQTNLLALNAGVEAARAGEAGKGFAVVAQEVRELAQRSASAAKEIDELIKNSGREVSEGVTLVKETGNMLKSITDDVKEVEQHMHNIAEATSEQSAGLEQINTAVIEMDETTHKNAAMVVQTNEVTQQVAAGSTAIYGMMDQFKTRDISKNDRKVTSRGSKAA